MPEKLIKTLISQHKGLRTVLGRAKNEAVKKQANFAAIDKHLKRFKKSLKEHLELENNFFYKELLEKYKGKKSDTKYIKKFIRGMDELLIEIYEFLKKYPAKKEIDKQFKEFKNELNFVIYSLEIRMSSEEKGVFLL